MYVHIFEFTSISIKFCGTDIYAPFILWHTRKSDFRTGKITSYTQLCAHTHMSIYLNVYEVIWQYNVVLSFGTQALKHT